ncbi:MAG: metallophosphoesterase family protein [Candidatus Marinimicrobia bacterium]|nr:metallophosphoesterase family protein [Candidatus Neomarinimicrobiota bacterium]
MKINKLILVLMVFVLISCDIGLSDKMRKAPYVVGNGEKTEMLILWQLYQTDDCVLRYGLDTKYSMGNVKTAEIDTSHLHKYLVTDLQPNTKYYYDVKLNNKNYSGSFKTAPKDDCEKLTFFAYGDTRTYPEIHNDIAKQIVSMFTQDSDLQTLIMHSGDYVGNSDKEIDWDEDFFNSDYSSILEMLGNISFYSCKGNHEFTGELYKRYFPYPYVDENFYWSFDYGPAHFIIIDQYTDYSKNSKQLKWLENDLASTDKEWKFLLYHEPAWSAGGGHENNKDAQKYIQPLCEKYDVAMTFSGHNHYYARAEVDGVVHLTTGGGGAPKYDPDSSYPNVKKVSKSHHFCKIEINNNKLKVEVITPDGKIIDEFIIEK